jgi:transcriptional regulator with XRE-family HTH domain
MTKNIVKTGEVIRILRMASGFSISELAKKAAVSIPLLSLIEKGERTPSMALLKKISTVLQIPMSSLILLLSDADDVNSDDPHANKIVETVQELAKIEEQLRTLINRSHQ